MSIFNLSERDTSFIGKVQAVDTANIVVKVENEDVLSDIQVNNLVIIQASKTRQTLIGMVNKIIRTFSDGDIASDEELTVNSNDIVKINMIGTLLNKEGLRENVFKRTLESVPEISSEVYIMNDENLSAFMNVISATSAEGNDPLNIGTYALNKYAQAYLDGNKFFQKHAVIV